MLENDTVSYSWRYARGTDIENQYLMCETDGDLYLIIDHKSCSARHRDVENPRGDRRTVSSIVA